MPFAASTFTSSACDVAVKVSGETIGTVGRSRVSVSVLLSLETLANVPYRWRRTSRVTSRTGRWCTGPSKFTAQIVLPPPTGTWPTMKAGWPRSNSMSIAEVALACAEETVKGETKLTGTVTVSAPEAPLAPWIWVRAAGTVLPAASGKPASGSLATVRTKSPGLALIVSVAPV